MTAGASVVTAPPALAWKGPDAGQLGLFPPIGPATLTPVWFTRDGCPSGFQGSAALYELNTDGSVARSISPVVAHVSHGFGGTLLAPVGQLITQGSDVRAGGTSEWVVGCFAGPGGTGNVEHVRSTDVTLSADGSFYWTHRPKPKTTTTTLTASPNPAAAGTTVTLTATVSAADGTIPAGSVAFTAGDTFIATVPLDATGTATTTTTFTAEGTKPRHISLSAHFFPSTRSYAGSAARYREIVNPAGTPTGDVENIVVIVPPHGVFTVTITPWTLFLTALDGGFAQGLLQDVTVTDTRNDDPGWSVSGQESDLTGSGPTGQSIQGNQLGWTPYVVRQNRGGTPGPTVAPAAPGLGTSAATFASAGPGHGFGTYALTARMYLAIPPTAAGGPVNGTLTITFVEASP